MKKILLLFILLITYKSIISQEYQSPLNKSKIELIGPEEIPDEVIIKVSQDESGFANVTIESFGNSNKVVKFSLKPFNYNLFKTKLITSFVKLEQEEMIPKRYDPDAIGQDEKIKSLYNEIASYFFTVNERPQVATINLKDEEEGIDVYASVMFEKIEDDKKKKKNYDKKIGKIEDLIVEISFYAGYIEKIEVRGQIDNVDITFTNRFSIGVSSIKNIKDFQKIKLYSLYSYDIEANKSQTAPEETNFLGKNFKVKLADRSEKIEEKYKDYKPALSSSENPFIYLDDIIDYQRIIDVNANDISPAKQKIALDKNQRSSNLYKEESTKLLEAVVYSDLLGALEEENPNGIIQTEISKRFNINTVLGDFLRGGIGLLEYIDGKVLLSKIEENNKFLLPTNNVFQGLDLYQYRNFSIGGAFNLATYENQNWKLNAFLETGAEFSRSGYRFTEDEQGQNTNSFEWSNQLKIHFFPEKRYGVLISDKISFYEILSTESDFLNIIDSKNNWLLTRRL